MITGTFTTAIGTVTLAINDGGDASDCNILNIGELIYSFDVTPEAVTIDRLQALYNVIKLDIYQYNDLGADLYSRLLTGSDVDVTLTINTHKLETFEFKFKAGANDFGLNEKTQTVTLNLQPKITTDTFKDVFDEIPNTLTYRRRDALGTLRSYDAVGVLRWIKKALNNVFDNAYENEVLSAQTGLGIDYTARNYVDDTEVELDQYWYYRRMLTLVDMGDGFGNIGDEPEYLTGLGFIESINFRPSGDNRDDAIDAEFVIKGDGDTRFTQQIEVGDGITIGAGDGIEVGIVREVANDNTLYLYGSNQVFGFSRYRVVKHKKPNESKAIDILKELAAIEGSVFGSGFSKNWYFNRLNQQTPIELDYDKVIELQSKPYSLFLGTSVVTQLATWQELDFRDSLPLPRTRRARAQYERTRRSLLVSAQRNLPDLTYGEFPSDTPTAPLRRFPNLNSVGSVSYPNVNATKELLIELAPAYPLLNKAEYRLDGGRTGNPYLGGMDDSYKRDDELEKSLTESGLRSYVKALSNRGEDVYIELQITDAFSVKPYDTFKFGTDAPVKYQGRIFRITEVSYNMITDMAKIKAYQIDSEDIPQQPVRSLFPTLSTSVKSLQFETFFQASATETLFVSGSNIGEEVRVIVTKGEYEVSLEETGDYSDEVVLSPDGFGNVGRTVYVRFRPLGGGVKVGRIVAETNTTTGVIRKTINLYGTTTENLSYPTVGELDGVVSGEVTQITANFFTKLKRGDEVDVVDSVTGKTYTVTVNQDTVNTGLQTITIEPQFMEVTSGYLVQNQASTRTGIYITDNQIVLKVDSNGNVASVVLTGDADDGTEININADQVKINDVEFVKDGGAGTGWIQSSNFATGSTGWRIDGFGNAEFSNVVARGTIEADSGYLGDLDIEGNVTVTNGSIRSSSSEGYVIDGTAIQFFESIGGSGNIAFVSQSGLTLSATGLGDTTYFRFGEMLVATSQANPTTDGARIRFSSSQSEFSIYDFNDFKALSVNLGDGQVDVANNFNVDGSTDSTSNSTGSITTSGGVGIAKSLYVGGAVVSFANLPTSDPAVAGQVWRSGNDLKISTG